MNDRPPLWFIVVATILLLVGTATVFSIIIYWAQWLWDWTGPSRREWRRVHRERRRT